MFTIKTKPVWKPFKGCVYKVTNPGKFGIIRLKDRNIIPGSWGTGFYINHNGINRTRESLERKRYFTPRFIYERKYR